MPKSKKQANEADVDNPCQVRLNSLANTALDVIESILLDIEAPISIRLDAAFKILQMCGLSSSLSKEMITPPILTEIEKNARNIEKNAQELAYLEALLRTHDANLQAHHAKMKPSDQTSEAVAGKENSS
jgi:hypothetical protein